MLFPALFWGIVSAVLIQTVARAEPLTLDLRDVNIVTGREIPTDFSDETWTEATENRAATVRIDLSARIEPTSSRQSPFSTFPTIWDEKTKTATIVFKDERGGTIPVTATFITDAKAKNRGVIVVSKAEHEVFDQYDRTFQAVERLKKDVSDAMDVFALQRKRLKFDEPATIFETIKDKVNGDPTRLNEEDDKRLRAAVKELVDALKEESKADMKMENEKIAALNRQIGEINQLLRSRTRLAPDTATHHLNFKRLSYVELPSLRTLRKWSERAKERLPEMLNLRIGQLKKRFDHYEEFQRKFDELLRLYETKKNVVAMLNRLENENVTLRIDYTY